MNSTESFGFVGRYDQPKPLSSQKVVVLNFVLKIFNKGIGEALDIRIEVNNKKFLISERIFVDEVINEVIYLEPDLVKLSKNLDFLNVEFTLICANKFNSQIKEHYEIEVYFIEDSWETERVNIIKR